MATYYINADTGNDTTGDGSSSNPWLTLNYAVSEAANNDTIVAQDSTNSYAFTSFSITGKGLTIQGESEGGAVFDGNGAQVQIDSRSTVFAINFLDLEFTNCSGYGQYDGIFRIGIANFTRCKFYNLNFQHGRAGIMQALADTSDEQTVVFLSCLFYNLNNTSSSSNEAGFLLGGNNDRTTTATLNNCVIHIYSSNNIRNITGDNNADKNLYLTNTILLNDSVNDIIIEPLRGESTMNYSCYYNFVNPPAGSNNINSDPLLIDPAANNYNLSPTSPCIDAGTLI
jgi:hypothetical protein